MKKPSQQRGHLRWTIVRKWHGPWERYTQSWLSFEDRMVYMGMAGPEGYSRSFIQMKDFEFYPSAQKNQIVWSVGNDMLRLELTAITSPVSWEVDWNKLLLDSVTYFRRLLKFRWEMMNSERKPLVWRTRVAVPAEFFIHWFFSSLVQYTESGY